GVRRLRERGVGLRWSALEAHYDGRGVPCRSHVARALRDVGLVSTHRGAYGRLLSSDTFEPSPVTVAESIAVVRAEGGVPVWAHPNPNAAAEHAPRLKTLGLMGLEAYTPSRRPGQIRRLHEIAESLELLVTGGSDYHGVSSAMPLGRWQLAWERVPDLFLAARR
ncbi:MAG: hypothetical protein KDC38_10985, partial [Planctomycetes bacterium]|nr:hypothetical protein [Planctomycetota bacterium]